MARKKKEVQEVENVVNVPVEEAAENQQLKDKLVEIYKENLWKEYKSGLAYGSQILAQMMIGKIESEEFKNLDDVKNFCVGTTKIPTEELEKAFDVVNNGENNNEEENN